MVKLVRTGQYERIFAKMLTKTLLGALHCFLFILWNAYAWGAWRFSNYSPRIKNKSVQSNKKQFFILFSLKQKTCIFQNWTKADSIKVKGKFVYIWKAWAWVKWGFNGNALYSMERVWKNWKCANLLVFCYLSPKKYKMTKLKNALDQLPSVQFFLGHDNRTHFEFLFQDLLLRNIKNQLSSFVTIFSMSSFSVK